MTEEDPIWVFKDTPWKIGLRAIVAFALLLVAVDMMTGDSRTTYFPQALVRPTGAVGIVLFTWMFLGLVGRLLRPRELVLNEAGFRVRGLLVDRKISWSDVQGFDANERQLGLMSVIYLLRQPPLGAAALLGVRRAIDVSPEEGPVEIVRHLKAFHRRYDAGQTLS